MAHHMYMHIVYIVVFLAMARSSSSAALALPESKRLSSLQGIGHHTKASTVSMLMELQKTGALDGEDSKRSLRQKVQTATEEHSKAMTPYGSVVQKMKLGTEKLEDWDICHPFAYLWYLTTISVQFATVMETCGRAGRPLRLVLYMDEMVPGNPFRADKGRTLMCIYWAFVDWPAHMLTRTFAWPCFSILRATVMNSLSGGASYLARLIMRIFFPESGDSLSTGVILKGTGTNPDYMITGVFAGWLCDLDGHKKVTQWKGWSGHMCCPDCSNLRKDAVGVSADGIIGLDCADPTLFRRRSNEDVFAIVDDLVARNGTMSKTAFENLQTIVGFNLVPNGLLLDMQLRTVYKPINHTIRDWQHTLVGDGVVNTLIAQVIRVIGERGFSLDHLRTFMSIANLPSKYGKADVNWLKDSRAKNKQSVSSFSSNTLNMLPIIFLFVEKFCKADPVLADVVRCVFLLHMIVGVLSTGPDDAPHHTNTLERLMSEFHALFTNMSDSLKPKLHHMHHIVDGIRWLGKALSCFVTERKHRTVKDSALHVFRHIEHTVLADIVNKQCKQMIEGMNLFLQQFLVEPGELVGLAGVLRSRTAMLRCGTVRRCDIVWLSDATCGRVNCFYEVGGQIFSHLSMFESIESNPAMFDECRQRETFCDARSIVDACTWYYDSPSIIKIVIPPIVIVSCL